MPRRPVFVDPNRSGDSQVRLVRHIAVEGVIGVGKTSLVHRLHAERGGRRVLELVEENPFLTGGFYEDMERFAFDVELFFLLARFRQQRVINQALEEGKTVLIDYVFAKNRIFAEITLSTDDFALWRRLFETLEPETPQPDLVVYLKSTTDRLMDRIQTRGRPFERGIRRDYIERVNWGYDRFFATYPGELLTIDVSALDFVSSDADFAALRALVEHRIGAIEGGQRELDLASTLDRGPSVSAGGA